MTISFSGLASGLDTGSWVDALVSVKKEKVTELQTKLKEYQIKKTTLNDTRSTISSFRSSIEKLTDKKFGGVFDLFGQSSATSSNSDILTATASTGALRQNYSLTVQQLATLTKAVSKDNVSAIADDETKLSNMGISKGFFNVYVDGVKTTINIGAEDTFGDLKSRLAEAGIKTEVNEEGILKFTAYEEGRTINIGSTTDTSNFTSLVGLAAKEDGSYESTNSLFKVNVATKITSENSGFKEHVTEGTFTIGDATFTIGENTTLSSLISQINDSDEAQATAFWDDTTGKLIITSKKEGASYINIEAGTSNFTDVMGLTETTRDEDGNIISTRLCTNNQDLGKNAMFTINGTSMVSTSNTVSEDISRITGVTITLKKVTGEEDGETTLTVGQETSKLVEAVKNFVDSYNSTISKIDEVTEKGADLQRESTLKSLKNTLKNYAAAGHEVDGSSYSILSQIGISVAKADGNNLSTDTDSLEFDEETFLKALEENPESVEELLAGEYGALNKMESAVETSLKAVSGFFDVKQSTLDSDIKRMEEKITRQNDKISVYKAQLEKKFSNMETLISQMQQNYSSFLTQ